MWKPAPPATCRRCRFVACWHLSLALAPPNRLRDLTRSSSKSPVISTRGPQSPGLRSKDAACLHLSLVNLSIWRCRTSRRSLRKAFREDSRIFVEFCLNDWPIIRQSSKLYRRNSKLVGGRFGPLCRGDSYILQVPAQNSVAVRLCGPSVGRPTASWSSGQPSASVLGARKSFAAKREKEKSSWHGTCWAVLFPEITMFGCFGRAPGQDSRSKEQTVLLEEKLCCRLYPTLFQHSQRCTAKLSFDPLARQRWRSHSMEFSVQYKPGEMQGH